MNKHEFIDSIKGTGQFRVLLDLISTKQYDKIYEYYGKTIYMLFAPSSHKKKDINKLMQEERYGEIYSKYGTIEVFFIKELHSKTTEERNTLVKEGRFEDIYRKYGDTIYSNPSIMDYFIKQDILNETGSISKYKLYKTKYKFTNGLKNILKGSVIVTTAVVMTIGLEFPLVLSKVYEENSIKYSEEISKYNSKIFDYADYINSLDLNDVQVIMKVLDDIWNDMEGYGEPKLDIEGFYRLDLLESNGVGVCRNIADDFTARMNAIDPRYNARNIIVYFDEKQYSKDNLANIDIPLAHTYEENTEDESGIDLTPIFGNHLVTILNPIDCDYNIIVDSTNPSIGVVKNGKIYMLQTSSGKGLSYKIIGEYLLDYTNDCYSINKSFISSIFNDISDEQLKEIVDKYGLDAQNEALDYIRQLNNSKTK